MSREGISVTSEMFKFCGDCHELKSVAEFYLQRDKPIAYCKICHHRRSKESQKRHPELEVRRRERRRDLIRSRNRTYQQRPSYVQARRNWIRANQARVAIAKHAGHIVRKAIRAGVLQRPDVCQGCGVECKPDAAHRDYERPLDVRWLCRSCHRKYDQADPKTKRVDELEAKTA